MYRPFSICSHAATCSVSDESAREGTKTSSGVLFGSIAPPNCAGQRASSVSGGYRIHHFKLADQTSSPLVGEGWGRRCQGKGAREGCPPQPSPTRGREKSARPYASRSLAGRSLVIGSISTSQFLEVGIPVPSVPPPMRRQVGGPYGTNTMPTGTLPSLH